LKYFLIEISVESLLSRADENEKINTNQKFVLTMLWVRPSIEDDSERRELSIR
jgi:hypothetical protein